MTASAKEYCHFWEYAALALQMVFSQWALSPYGGLWVTWSFDACPNAQASTGSESRRLLYWGKKKKTLESEKQNSRLWDWFWEDREVSRIPRLVGECSGKNPGLAPEDLSITLCSDRSILCDLGQMTGPLGALVFSSIKWGHWMGSIIVQIVFPGAGSW